MYWFKQVTAYNLFFNYFPNLYLADVIPSFKKFSLNNKDLSKNYSYLYIHF